MTTTDANANMNTNELQDCCQNVAKGWQQSRHGKTLHWIVPDGRALCGCKRSKHGWKPATVNARCPECEWRLKAMLRHPQRASVLEKICGYLGNGGLFNPEMMDHERVRDLLMECRALIEA